VAKNDTIALKLVADNNDLTKKLGQSTRQIKNLERQLERANKGGGGGGGFGKAFSPLANSAKSAVGPLSGVASKFSSVATAGAGMGPVLGGAAVAFAGVAEAVNFIGDGIGKLKALTAATRLLERETGMSAETSSAWVGIGKRFGLTAQQLSGQFGFLSKKIQIASGDTKAADKQLRIFASAGVSQSVLASKNMDRILISVANRFSKMPSGVAKTDLAMKLFGKSGKNLIPILDQGGGKVNKLKHELKLLGLTINGDTEDKIKKLNKAQKVLSDVWDGLQIQLATAVIPKLSTFADAVKDAVVGLREGKKPAGELAGQLYDVGHAFETVAGAIQNVANAASQLANSAVGRAVSRSVGALLQLIPHADGGIVTKPHIGLVGEAGPEAIIPLTRPARAAAIMREAGLMGGGSSNTFNIYNQGNDLDESALAAKIGWQLQARGVA